MIMICIIYGKLYMLPVIFFPLPAYILFIVENKEERKE